MNPWLARELIYPALHRVRRESVAAGVVALAESARSEPAVLVARQLAGFRAVAAAGAARFDFYRRRLDEAGVAPADVRTLDDLAAWPLMTKSDLAWAVADLRSDGGRRLPQHTVRLSGGSTGEPCVVLADREVSGRSLAARVLCQGWHGIRPGDRQIRFWGRPLPRGAWREHLKDVVLNRIRLDSTVLGEGRLGATMDRIRGFGAEYFYGYASLIRMFAAGLDAAAVAALRTGGLKAIISTSEIMPETQRVSLGEQFGVPVVDEYGCSEVDMIAFGCARGRRHVIAGNVLLEVVRQGDEPAGYGRAVVTDLNNILMPVIRYPLGDLIPLAQQECDCGCTWPCIGPVIGRTQDQFILLDEGRTKVHSQFVVYAVEQLVDEGWAIRRFQVVQENELCFALLVEPGTGQDLDADALQQRLREATAGMLGAQSSWEVRIVGVGSITTTAGGKFRHFVSWLSDTS